MTGLSGISQEVASEMAVSAAGLHRMMRERRSVRRYRADSVGRDVLDRLFLSAAMAPSGHNRQPWRYLVIEDSAAKRPLTAAATAMRPTSSPATSRARTRGSPARRW